MTQAACHLILFYSTARLSWKTVKSLRRSRRRSIHNNKQQSSSTLEDDVNNKINYDSNDALHDEEVEFEILQGWTIIALHTLYVSTGLEYAIRFIIPFYYHLKMLLLIAFTIPSSLLWRSGKDYGNNNSSYSLSPLIPFCFNCIIVPGVHKVHELMDNDPRGWALYVIAVIPLLMLDFVFLPGVLLTEEERSTIRNARLVDNRKTSSAHPHHPPPPPPTPPRRAFPPPISYATSDVSSAASYETMELLKSGDQSKEERDNLQQSSKKSTRPPTTPPHENDEEIIEQTPPCNTPTRRNIFEKGYSFTQTPLSPFLNKSGKKNSYNLSGFSPLAKSRITSSALRLRQFSRDHNMLSTTRTRSKSKSEENSHHGDESLTLPNIRRRNNVSDDIFESSLSSPKPDEAMDLSDIEFDEDEPPPKPQGRRNKRRERLSFGDHFREIVTGDASIRVRDHLFDLELPSVPSPSPRSRRRGGPDTKSKKKGLELSPNITTRRRSSRLAKKK